MKKYLPFLPGPHSDPRPLLFKIPTAGIVGLLLRLLVNTTDIDDKGLLISGQIDWIILVALSIVTVLLVLSQSVYIRGPGAYRRCFPASPISAAACALAAVSALVSAVSFWTAESGPFINPMAAAGHFFTGAVLTLAPVAFVLVGLCRLKGRKPNFLFHVVICIAFALQTLSLYRTWSFDPQLHHYCFQLLACICLTMTAYQLACFDTGKGSHKKLWFWGLTAVYLCLVSAGNGLIFLTGAVWAWTSLTNLRRPRKPAVQETEAKTEE